MSDLQSINAQFEVISAAFEAAQEACYSSSEYKLMKQIEQQYNELEEKLYQLQIERQKQQNQANKQTLISLGFECRTGYVINQANPEKGWKYCKYIIVHENVPVFDSININYEGLCNIENLALWIDQDSTWEKAWDKWSSLTIDEQNELLR